MEPKSPRHPVHVLGEFGNRIRVYDALGLLMTERPNAMFSPEDIGAGLVALVNDFSKAETEVAAWFAAKRSGGES